MNAQSASREPATLVGLDTLAMPYMSSFGWMYRLSRLNGVRTHQICHVFGLPKQAALFLRQGGRFPWTLFEGWLQDAGRGYVQRLGYAESRPYPVPRRLGAEASFLRGCRTCLSFGYHTYLHQLPWLQRCGWHDEPLVTACVCGAPLLPVIRTLRTHRLLACDCGYDHFDRRKGLLGMSEWPEVRVRRFAETYLRICRRYREHKMVVPPEDGSAGDVLAKLTASVYGGDTSTYRKSLMGIRVFDEVGSDHLIDAGAADAILRKWFTGIRGARPMTLGDYRRVEAFTLNAVHAWNAPPEFIAIDAGGISAHGFPLLSREDGTKEYALLEGYLFPSLSVGNCLVTAISAKLDRSPLSPSCSVATRRVVALALSDIAARVAMHHIESLASSPQAQTGGLWRRPWSAPLCLCTLRPRLSIKLGFSCGALAS